MFQQGLIVSCQAEEGSSFNNVDSILTFAKEAKRGGAIGLRLRGIDNTIAVRKNIAISIISQIKSYYTDSNLVLITPTFEDVIKLVDAGADYVAIDATGRNGYEHIIATHRDLDVGIVGDISHISEADKAVAAGCDILSTTLSGYTEDKPIKNKYCPDFELLDLLVKHFSTPILAEGRYWTLDHVKRAIDIGAHAVVIGSAITRPHLITEYFNSVF